jgi:methionyl-tRNA formyltransferase
VRITVLCSDPKHPVFPWLERWCAQRAARHEVALLSEQAAPPGGDALFLVSCERIVPADVRGRYRRTLVLHASDLPEGRGWSPHVWQVLEGRNPLVVSMIEAADAPDAGPLLAQRRVALEGHELYDEINARLFAAELELMDLAVENFERLQATPQDVSRAASSYRRRTPEDSRLDPQHSIAEQFDLLRVCDAERYPAFVELRGWRYEIRLRKAGRAPR